MKRNSKSKHNPQPGSYLQAAGKAAKAGKFAEGMKLLGKYASKAGSETAKEMKSLLGGAAEMYKGFHGRSAKEVLESHEALMRSGDYVALGDDPELWLRPVKGPPERWARAELVFDPADDAKLATDPHGEQLYLVGRNQALPLDELEEAGIATNKRFIELGQVHAISYTTEKVFDGFKPVAYAHQFGEETGELPTLVYDKESQRLLLTGGAYSIAPVDGDLAASPGIVN